MHNLKGPVWQDLLGKYGAKVQKSVNTRAPARLKKAKYQFRVEAAAPL